MNKQIGFSLVEVMIGMALGLIILAGASSLFVSTLSVNSKLVRGQRFEQTLQILNTTITSEIRRAGYANEGVTLTPNGLNGSQYFAQDGCVLFSHSTPTSTERFYGYLLNNGVVYVYNSDTFNNSCTLDLLTWTPVTSIADINVVAMTFTGSPTVSFFLNAKAVGQKVPVGDAMVDLERKITSVVQMRNS